MSPVALVRIVALFIPVLFVLTFPFSAKAAGLCDHYRTNNPSLYRIACRSEQTLSKPAGASSTFNASFNLNAAALPTEPTSIGLEVLTSRIRNPNREVRPTFAIIKGFKKFGAGIATSNANTFYADDLLRRLGGPASVESFQELEPARSDLPHLNIGTSLRLYSWSRGPSLRLGISARYNRISDSWGGGPALLLNWPKVTLGAGISREKISNFLPPIAFNSYIAGVRFSYFEIEYTMLKNDSGFGLKPIHIITGTVTWKRMILTLARRHLDYVIDGDVHQYHSAIQFLFSKNFSAGLLHNHIPGATTLGVQYFL